MILMSIVHVSGFIFSIKIVRFYKYKNYIKNSNLFFKVYDFLLHITLNWTFNCNSKNLSTLKIC